MANRMLKGYEIDPKHALTKQQKTTLHLVIHACLDGEELFYHQNRSVLATDETKLLWAILGDALRTFLRGLPISQHGNSKHSYLRRRDDDWLDSGQWLFNDRSNTAYPYFSFEFVIENLQTLCDFGLSSDSIRKGIYELVDIETRNQYNWLP